MNKTENKLVPELRFPEFKNDPEWEIKTVNDIANYENGKAHEQDIANDGKYKVVNSKFISTDGEVLKFTNKAFCLAESNDILMVLSDIPNGRAIAKCFYVDKNDLYTVNQRICKLKPFDVNGKFLYYLLNRNQFFLAFDDGVKQTNLKNEDVLTCPITLPKKTEENKEQQKIADCLSSLDEIITSHNDKLEILKNHKKGLLQNLFPQEGETVPKFRFPQFIKEKEWETKSFGTVATFINGRAYRQEELLNNGKYRVLRVGNFFTNNNWYYSNLELEDNKYCNNGDLLYAWSASFGPKMWNGEKVIYHYHIWKVIPNPSIDKNFLFVLLDNETERMKSQNANGFALLHITKGTIENWECCIPISTEEQKKIAECLLAIDDLINSQIDKIDQLKDYKKGLMQRLFPQIA